MRAACPNHLLLLHLIKLTVLREQYKLWIAHFVIFCGVQISNIFYTSSIYGSRDNSMIQRLAMGWTIGVRVFNFRRGLGIFLFTIAFRLVPGPTEPRIKWVPGVLYLGVKRPVREADYSPPSSAEVKNAWSYTPLPQYAFMAWCSVKAQGQLYLIFYLSLCSFLMVRGQISFPHTTADNIDSLFWYLGYVDRAQKCKVFWMKGNRGKYVCRITNQFQLDSLSVCSQECIRWIAVA
jgi:hypothetical protein